jgi:hypothetical protein
MIKHKFSIRLNGVIEIIHTDDKQVVFNMRDNTIKYDGKELNGVTMIRYEGEVNIEENPYKDGDLFSGVEKEKV